MKRFFLVLLSAVAVSGVLVGAGYIGYRVGFNDGAHISFNGDDLPLIRHPNFDFERGPFAFDRGFEHRFDRGFLPGGFERMHRRDGFGGFGLFRFFIPLAILGLLGLIVYLLFTRSGWQVTRTPQPVQNPSPSIQSESKPEQSRPENE